MTVQEMQGIYAAACRRRHLRPNQGEGQAWYRELKDLAKDEVEKALEAWESVGQLDFRGKKRLRWLPSAAELRALVTGQRLRARREAQVEAAEWISRICSGAARHRWTTLSVPTAADEATRCPWCQAEAYAEREGPYAQPKA